MHSVDDGQDTEVRRLLPAPYGRDAIVPDDHVAPPFVVTTVSAELLSEPTAKGCRMPTRRHCQFEKTATGVNAEPSPTATQSLVDDAHAMELRAVTPPGSGSCVHPPPPLVEIRRPNCPTATHTVVEAQEIEPVDNA
jgi:hypothetical protein